MIPVRKELCIPVLAMLSFSASFSQTKILFDAAETEAASNAGWGIAADAYNPSVCSEGQQLVYDSK